MGAHPTTRYPRREITQSNKLTMLAAVAEAGVSVWQMLAWETKSIDWKQREVPPEGTERSVSKKERHLIYQG